MRGNIPMELRALPQWVCSGDNKVPFNPRTGEVASVIDPSTWISFEEALHSGSKYIGFVLTDNDPYTIIDLDNKPEKPCTEEQWERHQKILEAFDSYTERSASGTGYHIIVKGRLPTGARRDNVEIYSTARYMICTGDVVRNAPIQDYQALLEQLYLEMTPALSTDLVDYADQVSDMEIVEMAGNALNGDKFLQLCHGDWQAMGYPSQSEADLALLSILAFYTQSNEQVRRIFRMSGLGKREKAVRNDKYLDYALKKIRAHQPGPVDFSQIDLRMKELQQDTNNSSGHGGNGAEPPPAAKSGSSPSLDIFPPGLVGEVAYYIYKTAVRPVPEIALAAAISLVSGLCGRSYNISGTGLNQYLILLAGTGSGKEGAVSGINRLMAAIRPQLPMVDQFMGPSVFSSGQALIKVLDERPCFVSVLGEFGLTLQQICDYRANSAQIMLRKVLLDLYGKSGWNEVLRSTVYADVEKNTKIVQAPCVTILGESTPETFFEGLSGSHIAEGLIPRFSIIEYKGKRPPRNRAAGAPPDQGLAQRLADLVAISLTTANNHTCAGVSITSDSSQLLDEYDIELDKRINQASADIQIQLWNRAHLKSLKLAALIAVGINPHSPTITRDLAEWAIGFVEKEVGILIGHFDSGDIGTGDHRLESHVGRAVSDYFKLTPEQHAGYKIPKGVRGQPAIPLTFLRRRTRLINDFRNDKRGANRALKETLEYMVTAEELDLVPAPQAAQLYGVRSPVYVVGQNWSWGKVNKN